VTPTESGKPESDDRPDAAPPGKRRYEKPKLTDYGQVSKLTQTGGITTRDTGSMLRQCL
jgi:hypothetical protein